MIFNDQHDLYDQSGGLRSQPGLSEQNPLSVSALNAAAKGMLESAFDQVWILGEISNFVRPASGHWYFTLKDDRAQVRCAMFRNRNQTVRWIPENGMSVLVCARASIYENRGEYQLIANALLDAGAGSLQQAFEELKRKLEGEGLFSQERKLSIPSLPSRLGVVTSGTGAALQDILKVLNTRCPLLPVTVFSSTVQGAGAPAELIAALRCADRDHAVDLIIIGRGGGSAEDLACFNDEGLARAIAACRTPVISAVGHETDITICDLVADLRAPTPSAAAEYASPVQADWLLRARQLTQRQSDAISRLLRHNRQLLRGLSVRLQHPGRTLERHAQTLDGQHLRLQSAMARVMQDRRRSMVTVNQRLASIDPGRALKDRRVRVDTALERLRRAGEHSLTNSTTRFATALRHLEQLSPLATMSRGYAIASLADGPMSGLPDTAAPGERDRIGTVVSSASKLKPGDHLELRFQDGQADCLVERLTLTDGD